jgi:glutamate racemase
MEEEDRHRAVQEHRGHGGLRALHHPIGVFDSGVGGLSILKALRAELPAQDFVYFADTGHAPYGERDEAYVVARTRVVVERLRAEHGIQALVIACNTATAAAVHLVRSEHADLPVVGVEPALKPRWR